MYKFWIVKIIKDGELVNTRFAENCTSAIDACRQAYGVVAESMLAKNVPATVFKSEKRVIEEVNNPDGWTGFEFAGGRRDFSPRRGWIAKPPSKGTP